jgi:lysophospholipase L1-like esterase
MDDRQLGRWSLLMRLLVKSLKILLFIVIMVELSAFLAITLVNLVTYRMIREGDTVVSYDPYTLFLNIKGVRPTTSNPALKPDHIHLTIWLFGGSTMRGATDQDDQTIPSHLSKLLNGKDSREQYALVNFGEISFNSLLETKYLQKVLIERPERPEVIIFYDGVNDSQYLAQYRNVNGHLGYRRVKALVESYSQSRIGLFKPLAAAIYTSSAKEFYDKISLAISPITEDSPLLRSFTETLRQRYDYINRTAACNGATFLLFWQPLWWVETQSVEPAIKAKEEQTIRWRRFKGIRQTYQAVYAEVEQALHRKPYFYNLRNALCPRQEFLYKQDGIHLNNQGRQVVASHFYRVLQERLNSSVSYGSR